MSQHYLATPLRRALERAIKQARIVAEAGAAEAIRRLGVAETKAPTYLSDDEKELRRRLRAHARTLGDRFDRDSEGQEVKRLAEAAAYAHWHRMLFARFLAERGLLMHPQHNVPVTLEDCREIAEEEGSPDAWTVAERYAAAMLPAVFRIDDPVLSLNFDPAQEQALHRLVTDLDDDVFQAEDSLGWTYQFWRAAEKDAVNRQGGKIGADEISAVTQLFTEPYMVRFMLHNTLGAWWAGKVLTANADLAKNAADEDALRAGCGLPGYSFDMLRFVRDGEGDDPRWRPAAGTFSGWPKEAKAITMLDPCCGSGHFLTEALAILVALRRAEERLPTSDAVAAVLRDNLHGLEIDGRCVQIAAFAVALTAWRVGGWQILPLPHIAWVGAPPPLPKREFVTLAEGDKELEQALDALHDLFAQAPLLGTLLEPTGGDLVDPRRIARVGQLLTPLLAKTRRAEPEKIEGVVAARGMTDAALLLTRRYVLQVTNVPFLGFRMQSEKLADYLALYFDAGKADLATSIVLRIMRLASKGGTVATVLPQHSLYLKRYAGFRQGLISSSKIDFAVTLGPRAFETISGEVVRVALTSFSIPPHDRNTTFFGFDLSDLKSSSEKSLALPGEEISQISSSGLKRSNDYIISTEQFSAGKPLGDYAQSLTGAHTLDINRFRLFAWEPSLASGKWNYHQSSPDDLKIYSGYSFVSQTRKPGGSFYSLAQEMKKEGFLGGWLSGNKAWSRNGIACGCMNDLPATPYFGAVFDNMVTAIIPRDDSHRPAIYAFCKSPQFNREVRKLNKKLQVANATLLKVPFDLGYWQEVADADYPDGVPRPYSDDPTQWLFHGHPAKSDKGTSLHVALARLCGYRWPAELDVEMRLSDEAREWIANAAALPEGDNDGLLAVAGVAGEKPLADRLRGLLAAAFGAEWSDALERRLVAEADEALDKKQAKDGSLEAWLRDRAFRQHCALFYQRPFLWHIWDGLKDGFSAVVHYHRFTQGNLRKLTYTMLGDWLARAKAESNDLRYEKGRVLQQTLEKVLEGEAPHDIFVRWKSRAQHPLGWDPDLDDGVRMNIRPFMEAGLLREQPKGIKWTKDRGNDVSSAPWYPVFKGERINDHHTTLDEKRTARTGNPRLVAAK